MKEIYQAFKNRIEKGIKYHPKKPKPIIEIIQKLEENIVEWTPETAKEALFKEADKFFNNEIRFNTHKTEPKKWHKSLKQFTRYNKQTQILNLNNGPIAQIDQWKKANKEEIKWEEVD